MSAVRILSARFEGCSRKWAVAGLWNNVIQYVPSRPSRARELKLPGEAARDDGFRRLTSNAQDPMDITLAGTVLCSDGTRSVDGAPVGPGNLAIGEVPGVVSREYVGADRTAAENVRYHHGTMTFEAARIFASESLAASYALVGHRSEPLTGELKYGSETIYANAGVTNKRLGLNGRCVTVIYTIEG